MLWASPVQQTWDFLQCPLITSQLGRVIGVMPEPSAVVLPSLESLTDSHFSHFQLWLLCSPAAFVMNTHLPTDPPPSHLGIQESRLEKSEQLSSSSVKVHKDMRRS
ncbi:hypothetical protein GN956_G5259 [Arapaima gigas]